MRRRLLVHSLGALLLASLGVASAQDAYTTRPMNVRAGPNRDYPLVAQLDAGAPLDLHGCLDDWSWCDVSFEDNRGWIYAGGVSFVYEGQRVPLYSYGPHLGLPVITFSLTTYWGDYYRGRPWYAQRNTWSHRTLPPHNRPHGQQFSGPPPAQHGRPSAGNHEPSRGEERGNAMPQERPNGGRQSMPPNEHPSNGGHAMPKEPPSNNGRRPPAGGQMQGGGAQHGHTAPATRGPAKQRPHEQGHPPGQQ
jgi:uncharacterized protein YraI